jgi:hypothetical protein
MKAKKGEHVEVRKSFVWFDTRGKKPTVELWAGDVGQARARLDKKLGTKESDFYNLERENWHRVKRKD